MRKMEGIAFAFVLCLISAGFMLRSTAPSAAQPGDIQVKDLLQDITAYLNRCAMVESSPPTPLSRSCANEKAELLRRQHDLRLSDADVNAQLKGRGGFGRWP